MRSVVVILAVLGVLLCPYDCAVRAALGRATGESASCKSATRACCAKCRAKPPAGEQHSPRPDDPRKDGHSCLCEGVVFTPSAHQDLDWLLMSSQASLDLIALPSVGSDFPIGTVAPDESPPLPRSGWQLRIVMLSFLI